MRVFELVSRAACRSLSAVAEQVRKTTAAEAEPAEVSSTKSKGNKLPKPVRHPQQQSVIRTLCLCNNRGMRIDARPLSITPQHLRMRLHPPSSRDTPLLIQVSLHPLENEHQASETRSRPPASGVFTKKIRKRGSVGKTLQQKHEQKIVRKALPDAPEQNSAL